MRHEHSKQRSSFYIVCPPLSPVLTSVSLPSAVEDRQPKLTVFQSKMIHKIKNLKQTSSNAELHTIKLLHIHNQDNSFFQKQKGNWRKKKSRHINVTIARIVVNIRNLTVEYLNNLFPYSHYLNGGRRQERSPRVYSSNICNSQGWPWPKIVAWNQQITHINNTEPSTWVITYFFPQCINRSMKLKTELGH